MLPSNIYGTVPARMNDDADFFFASAHGCPSVFVSVKVLEPAMAMSPLCLAFYHRRKNIECFQIHTSTKRGAHFLIVFGWYT